VTAYAIVQRVPNATPRLRPPDNARSPDWRDLAPPSAPDVASLPALEADDDGSLTDRLAAVRAALAQTTWYLLNSDGWR
jgi:hypothetical protein